jgi:hypothetical protein
VPTQGGAFLETQLRAHRHAFLPLHPPRMVHNVYFDTPSLRCLHDNIAGNRDRFKVRIRWYGADPPPAGIRATAGTGDRADPYVPEAAIASAVLEIKRKQGFAGIKSSFPLGALDLSRDLAADRLAVHYAAAGVPAALRSSLATLTPVIYNRYRRRYLRSVDGRFRATIDDAMRFRQLLRPDLSFRGRQATIPGSVIELKYRLEDEAELAGFVGDLPYRVSRNSKYVTGMRACWR